MARTPIASQSFLGSYPELPLAALEADLMFTAIDDPLSRSTPLVDSKTVVLALNTDGSSHTVTFTSVLDSLKRDGDITNYSVAAGKIAAFGPFRSAGWAQGSNLFIDVSDAKLRLAVIRLP